MTAVLNELRALDARMKRGELSDVQYASARAALLHRIEDAEAVVFDTPPNARPVEKASGGSAVSFGLVVCLLVVGFCLSLTLMFVPDVNLALTLGVTILAALCVALLQEKEEEE
ncbi:MAG: SHOCT domain-containing protein [Roseobacter sp.]